MVAVPRPGRVVCAFQDDPTNGHPTTFGVWEIVRVIHDVSKDVCLPADLFLLMQAAPAWLKNHRGLQHVEEQRTQERAFDEVFGRSERTHFAWHYVPMVEDTDDIYVYFHGRADATGRGHHHVYQSHGQNGARAAP